MLTKNSSIEIQSRQLNAGKPGLLGSIFRFQMRLGICKSRSIEESLSGREFQVAYLFAHGRTRQSISYQIGVTCLTVDTYLQRIYRRLDVHTDIALLKLFEKEGIN